LVWYEYKRSSFAKATEFIIRILNGHSEPLSSLPAEFWGTTPIDRLS